MRKRGMSLNRKKLREKVRQLETEKMALSAGMAVVAMTSSMQNSIMRVAFLSELASNKAQLKEGGRSFWRNGFPEYK